MARNNCCVWDFTVKAEGLEVDDLKIFLTEHCKKWVFQLEEGESGYIHYQGRISLKVKSRKGPTLANCRWSVTSKENDDNDFYVTKRDTRVGGPWSDRDKYIPKQVRNIILKPWQQDIIDNGSKWDTRTINILYCKTGNIGKSTLATYAGCRNLARSIPMMDSFKDYMRMVMDCPKSNLYLIDFPRSMNKQSCAGFWSAIESIKNGYAYDDRYGFKEEYFDCPNVWIFTNTLPDTDFLSKDRWVYWIVEDDILHKYDPLNPGYFKANDVL